LVALCGAISQTEFLNVLCEKLFVLGLKKLVSRKGQGGSRAKVAEEVAKPDFSVFSAENFAFSARKKEASRKGHGGSRKTEFLCVLCKSFAFSARNFAFSARKNKIHAKDTEEVAKPDFSAFSAKNFSFSV
jgi:hypothetical protein